MARSIASAVFCTSPVHSKLEMVSLTVSQVVLLWNSSFIMANLLYWMIAMATLSQPIGKERETSSAESRLAMNFASELPDTSMTRTISTLPLKHGTRKRRLR